MNRPTGLLVFLGVFAIYAGLSPGTIWRSGYISEEMEAGDSMIAVTQGWLTGNPAPPMKWTRHGPLAVVLDIPFLVLGKTFISEDFVLSFDPVLETALLIILLFTWLRRLTSPGLAFLLSISGAFGTMLWPYAYISLETKQSLFLMLAGYLALESRPIDSYVRALVFGACCGLAVAMKSTGLVLLPAIAYLIYVQFGTDWRRRIGLAFTTLAVIGVLLAVGALGSSHWWATQGTSRSDTMNQMVLDNPFQYLGNVLGQFGSPVKGLFFFAPPLLLSLYAIPGAWRRHRNVTLFVLFTVGGMVSGFACFVFFADEVWGPRYLHTCVAPLLLLIGASREHFSPRRDAVLFPLLGMGVIISFLGASYYYGVMHFATMRAGENTEEELVGDPKWNQAWFNARLLSVWIQNPSGPALWTPGVLWMYRPPPDAPPPRTIDLREWAQPQFFLLGDWIAAKTGWTTQLWIVWVLFLTSTIVGPLLLFAAGSQLKHSREPVKAAATVPAEAPKTSPKSSRKRR